MLNSRAVVNAVASSNSVLLTHENPLSSLPAGGAHAGGMQQ